MSTESILEELLVWTKVGFYGAARSTLESVLNTNKKRLAYQAADGTKTAEAIRAEVRISPNDIGALFKTCQNMGLMRTTEDGKRVRLFDLTQFGLEGNVSEGE